MNPFSPASSAGQSPAPARPVGAVLGPTNTGKTHLAIERMLGHSSGVIGLPLRLLAREVYNKVVARVGADQVALITGEEKIKPRNARYWIATVEAMPRDLDVAFVAVDEIQLAADLDRGHTFTDRLLNRRGRDETMMIGAATIAPALERLLPNVTFVSRPRLSNLTFVGEHKLSRLPRRSAIVAFSAEEVYAIAELIRRQRGGAAVVLGALSPRTRNAQVAMYQAGEVDFIVATDAIGMGLNLDVDHVAFASDRKFDGWQYRRLNPAEFAQIAGRAGRHANDGTFGTTGRCPPFEEELVEALETHRFDTVSTLQWRNADLDFSTIDSLQNTLEREPGRPGLTRAPLNEDMIVLDILSRDPRVRRIAATKADVQRLWEACQVPDYRKVSPSAHAELVDTLYGFVVRAGRVPDDWFAKQLQACDRTTGDIDALSARIAQVRTYNFIANRPDWLSDPEHWQGVTRQVEDNLSDALHERLTHRFVDRRTSVLMRRLRENAMLEAEITAAGDVLVEGQHIGLLHGFRFTPDPQAEGEAQRTLNAAALKALANELEGRAQRVSDAVDQAFVLAHDGVMRWLGEPVGKLSSGDHILKPRVRVLSDDQLPAASLELVQRRLNLWIDQHVKKLLGPLLDLESGEGLEGIARGVAFQVGESLGVLERSKVANDIKSLDQNARGALRKLGVRFGAHHIYVQPLLKPAPRALAAQLWALKHGGLEVVKGFDEVPHLAASGRTSFAADKEAPRGLYLAAGFRVCGERVVRVDILERLADLIRPAIAYRPGVTPGEPPAGAADGDGFVVTVAMTSLVGCSGEAFASILKSLGYGSEKRKGPAITVPLVAAAATTPIIASPAADTKAESADEATTDSSASEETTSEVTAEPQAAAEAAPAAETPTEAAVESESQAEAAAPEVEAPLAEPEAPAAEPEAPATEPEAPAAETEAPATEPEAPAAEPEAPAAETEAPAAEVAASDQAVSEDAGEAITQASGPDVVEASGEPATEDENLIDVWRPQRQQQHRRPQGRDQQRRGGGGGGGRDRSQFNRNRPQQGENAPVQGAPVEGAPAAEGASTPATQDRPQGNRPQGERPHGERPQGARPQGDRPQGERPQGDRPPRRDNRNNDNRRNEGAGQRPGGPRPPRRDDRPGQRHGGPGERSGERSGGQRQFASSEAPRREREKQPDPNSPFAKLLALKQQLEGKSPVNKGSGEKAPGDKKSGD
ncbi:MAG: helicase-related protein [Beijerinckiaceae bacterium]|nr:helicase-related protein [Beijerinckiaceae bacterium]